MADTSLTLTERQGLKIERQGLKVERLEARRNPRHSIGVTTYENLAKLVNVAALDAPSPTGRPQHIIGRVTVQYKYAERDVLAFASPKTGATYKKHENGKCVWDNSQQEDAFLRFAQLAHEVRRALASCTWTLIYFANTMQSKDKHELVWNCCNPFVAALLAAAQVVHGTPAESMLGVWDTQYYSSSGAKQADQSICAIACRPSEHIAVSYNEVVYERLDAKHVGKMGQYLKTALEANPQLMEAYGLLMCKSSVQVHRIVRSTSNEANWPFTWESSPELVFAKAEDGGVAHLTKLWLAHWGIALLRTPTASPRATILPWRTETRPPLSSVSTLGLGRHPAFSLPSWARSLSYSKCCTLPSQRRDRVS